MGFCAKKLNSNFLCTTFGHIHSALWIRTSCLYNWCSFVQYGSATSCCIYHVSVTCLSFKNSKPWAGMCYCKTWRSSFCNSQNLIKLKFPIMWPFLSYWNLQANVLHIELFLYAFQLWCQQSFSPSLLSGFPVLFNSNSISLMKREHLYKRAKFHLQKISNYDRWFRLSSSFKVNSFSQPLKSFPFSSSLSFRGLASVSTYLHCNW